MGPAMVRKPRLRAVHDKIKLPDAYVIPKKSVPAAGAENEKGKACDDHNNNDHPVLAFEAKKGKVLDQKVQRPRAPIFRARRKIMRSGFKNILFLYFDSVTVPQRDLERRANQSAAMSSKRA
jgi:hypothetical protein